MADPSATFIYNSMYSAAGHKDVKGVIDQTSKKYPLLYWLKQTRKINERGGYSVRRRIQIRDIDTAQTFGRGASFAENDPDCFTMAEYNYQNIGDSLTRYWLDEQIATGKEQMIDLVKENTRIVEKNVEKKLSAQFWATTPGASDFNGVPYFVSATPSTGTAGGISRSTETWWRNQQKTATGSAYTYLLDDTMNLFNTLSQYEKPDFAMAGQTVFELFNAVTREQKFITDKRMGDAEFANIAWNSMPIMLDMDAPSGSLYLMNSDYLDLHIDPKVSFKWTDWKSIPNKLDLMGQYIVRGQLMCWKLICQGVLTGIAA